MGLMGDGAKSAPVLGDGVWDTAAGESKNNRGDASGSFDPKEIACTAIAGVFGAGSGHRVHRVVGNFCEMDRHTWPSVGLLSDADPGSGLIAYVFV